MASHPKMAEDFWRNARRGLDDLITRRNLIAEQFEALNAPLVEDALLMS